MKLTKHQKEIISKILNKDIYDIASYLKCFNLCHIEKYDMKELEKEFIASEKGKQYKVMKDGHSRFKTTTINTTMATMPISLPNIFPRTDITDDEWEYKSAEFIPHTRHIEYEFEEHKFEFDFDTGVNVLNDFNNLIDFFTLWNYLKQESLIFEVNMPISSNDIGLFFEPITLHKNNSITVDKKYTDISKDSNFGKLINKIPIDIYDKVPTHTAIEFTNKTWHINEENLTMSREFIGKKIIPSSALYTYSKCKYKTNEEKSQFNNLVVAWIAVGISILSIFASSFFDKTPKQLNNITEQIEQIQAITNEFNTTDITEIKTSLENIESIVNSLRADENTIDAIKKELSEIKGLLID